MDDRRRQRREYKRKWIAAKRARVAENPLDSIYYSSDDEERSSTHSAGLVAASLNTEAVYDYTGSPARNSPSSDDGGSASFEHESDDGWNIVDSQEVVSSDSDDDNFKQQPDNTLADDLAAWVATFQVKQNAVDRLLELLKQSGHPDLPSTARTLMKTVRSVSTKVKSGMEYVYLGLEEALRQQLRIHPTATRETVQSLELSFNIDGLPLFKSSSQSLWPVLCAITNLEPVDVFPVVLTLGKSKPTDLEFLSELINDLNELLRGGLQDGATTLGVHVACVICDAPAKAFVKQMKQYSGYYGCDKCTQRGRHFGRMTFPKVTGIVLRTDESFRHQLQEEHHKGVSPFCDLPIDMVRGFPIDYMHQVCLGSVRRLILVWLRLGSRNVRLSANQASQISQRLDSLKGSIPTDYFARKPRGLKDIDRWKATEYRQFLLYTGPIVLKDILRLELYNHFMCFSVATAILVCPQTAASHREYARALLEYFVSKGRELYGRQFLVYNIHSLIHLSAEAEQFGTLDKCSAFAFENYMQKLKRLVRTGRSPLVQIVKRLSEVYHTAKRLNAGDQLLTKISARRPTSAFIIDGEACCEVVSTRDDKDENGDILYVCRVYGRPEPIFNHPCDSRLIGAYKVWERNASMKVIAARRLVKRAVLLQPEWKTSSSLYFLTILHEHGM